MVKLSIVANVFVMRGELILIAEYFILSDPDRIVRIENQESRRLSSPESNGDTRSSVFRRVKPSTKAKKHPTTPRRREVLLSKISIYIVYMFVCCHRFVTFLLLVDIIEFVMKLKSLCFEGHQMEFRKVKNTTALLAEILLFFEIPSWLRAPVTTAHTGKL